VPVAARRTFQPGKQVSLPTYSSIPHPPPAVAEVQTPSAAKKKVDWPLGVRQYVQRCFVPENLLPGIAKVDMEAKLKTVITQAAESNNLNSVDWAKLPLPQQMLQEEHKRSILSQPPVVDPRHPTYMAPTVLAQPPVSQQDTKSKSLGKRKSSDFEENGDDGYNHVPWRQNLSTKGFEDRISFAPANLDKRQRLEMQTKNHCKSPNNLDRKKRFEKTQPGFRSPWSDRSTNHNTPVATENTGPVIGRCEDLEKNYFRLTSAPKPETVRPLPILLKTLELLKSKWKKDANYTYICDQFKSLRQDLTVQHIKNEFTVTVYEIHARIALEKGDLGEYNQCQTQLRALYGQNLGGHPMEFKAYRILYFMHTCNRTDMNDVLSELTLTDKTDRAVKHALEVRSALALGNYHRFFQLFLETPNMGAYLMDMFVARERLAALASICKV
jgi:SAC3 family protein LENG8/THP3